jgi:autotransporter-associated beta strand protein
LRFQSPAGEGRLRRRTAALLVGVAASALFPAAQAYAGTAFTWGGFGSTTTTSDYNTATNWSTLPPGAPPVAAGQGAIFDSMGSNTVNVSSTIAPDYFQFTGTSQSYFFTGADINFSSAAVVFGGIFDTANLGQVITIGNNLGESVPGVSVILQGSSTLVLTGTNSYSGGTQVIGGALVVNNSFSVGTGTVTLDGGLFQADGSGNIAFANNFKINTGAPSAIDANGVQLTISGNITDGNGPGSLTVLDTFGGGAVILTGKNTYTGGTLICSCATLQLGDATHTGSLVGAIANEGTFNVVNADTSGITTLLNDGGGFSTAFTTFQNATSAGTMTITNHGSNGFGAVLLFQDSSTADHATIVNRFNGLTEFFGTSTAANANIVNHFGGQTHFADQSNAGGATIVNHFGGFTAFFNESSAANATITNKFGGVTAFVQNSTAGNAIILNGSDGGILAPFGLGFFDNSTAGNATITNNKHGLIAFGFPGGTDTVTAGNASITNNAGSATAFFANSTAGNATIINNSDGGKVSPFGLGFFDNATAGNATIINNNLGLIAFGFPFGFDTPTAGSANITNNAGGHIEFNAFSTAGNAVITTLDGGAIKFFDNSTGGNAQFITNGTGYVDFGESFGPNGDGRITAGSIAGSGLYYIGGGNTLVVGGNNLSTTVSGVIADNNPCGCTTGPGSLEKVGAGQLTLSGINTYTGTTVVNGGILDVEGSIASSILTTVNLGGVLTGLGTVGNTVIANGGIFLPGIDPPGTFTTVAGNLAFQSGALYLVTLNSTSSTQAIVTGTASLGGNVGAAFIPGSSVMKQYTILTAAGGVNGTFAGFSTTGLPAALVATLSYDANHAFINFAINFNSSGPLNGNQQAVANALTNFFNANGGIPAVFAALTPAGLSQASGEVATGTQSATFDAMNLFMGLLTDPFVAGRGNGVAGGGGGPQGYADDQEWLAYAAKKSNAARDALAKIPAKSDGARNDLFDARWSVWGAAYGGGASFDGNAALGSNSATVRAFGFVGGADYRISPATLVGFAFAGGGTNFAVNGFGNGRSDLFQFGAFVRHTSGPAYISAAAAYGFQDVTTDRTVFAGAFDRLHAEFNSNAWSGRVEGGYRFLTPWMGITPYAAAQATLYSLPAYSEQVLAGMGVFALSYAAKDVTASRTELGLRTDRSFAMADGILTLRGRFAWAHDFNGDRNISAVFQTLPGAAFIVNGAAAPTDSALTTVSIEKKWLNGWSAAATFEGEFSPISTSYAGKGVVRYTW